MSIENLKKQTKQPVSPEVKRSAQGLPQVPTAGSPKALRGGPLEKSLVQITENLRSILGAEGSRKEPGGEPWRCHVISNTESSPSAIRVHSRWASLRSPRPAASRRK